MPELILKALKALRALRDLLINYKKIYLVKGFLFNEQIIQNLKDIENIESFGDKVGQWIF